jgi:hypothetical protein
MNPPRKELQELLEHVLPQDAPACGPDRATILRMVREEGARRRQRRGIFAALAAVAAAGLINLAPGWRSSEGAIEKPAAAAPAPATTNTNTIAEAAPVVPVHAPSGPSPVVIHEVDDQQFLALLQDTPAALMVWPNGQRTLLVVER